MRHVAIGFAATMLVVAPAPAAERTDARIAALRAEAAALKAGGDAATALERARAGLALAEKDPGPGDANLYEALDALSDYLPDSDLEQQFQLYARLAPLAARVKGADSYPALSTLAGRNVLAVILGKPGASIPAFADVLVKAMAVAGTEKEQAQVTGLAMILAQLYDATGQHPKAVEVVASAGRFYESPPAVPNSSYAPGLMSLALRYSDWQQWDKAIDAADRAIAASVAFHKRRVVEIASAQKVRGNAFIALGRYTEAEAAFRDAVVLADKEPDLGVTTSALFNLARLYMSTGRDSLARPLLLRIEDMLRDKGPKQSNTRMIALLDLHNIATRAGDNAGALAFAKAARADADTRGFAGSPVYLGILLAVANASTRLRDFDTATAAVEAAEALLPKAVSPGSPRYADVTYARASIAIAQRDLKQAVALMRSSIELWEKSSGAEAKQIASARSALARALYQTGDASGAWSVGRRSAAQMSAVVIDRAGRGGADLLDDESSRVFDSAVELAWATRTRAR